MIHILRTAELDALVVDDASLRLLTKRVFEAAPDRILYRLGPKPPQASLRPGEVGFNSFSELSFEGPEIPVSAPAAVLAYIIYTSGTTGTPKGVMIEAESVAMYCGVVQEQCGFRPTDRVSQVAELTFDNSVLDLFVTWAAGAGLYVIPASQLMAPAKFIRDHELNIWFSVPSTACILERLKNAEAWLVSVPAVFNFCGRSAADFHCADMANCRPEQRG